MILPGVPAILVLNRGIQDGEWNILFVIFILFGIWGIALILGVFVSAIARKPKWEPYFYLSAQILVALVIAGFFISEKYEKYQHEKAFGNIEDNHRFVGIRNGSAEQAPANFIGKAFVRLESAFSDHNSFRLTKYTTTMIDTLVDSGPGTIHTVYFTYLFDNKVLFSAVRVFGDSAAISLFNANPGSDKAYQISGQAFDRKKKEDLESLKKALLAMPDSTRKKIVKVLTEDE